MYCVSNRSRMNTLCASLFVAAVLAGRADAAVDANWPGWRGDGGGVSTQTNLPVQWDAETNIMWKRALPGEGNSSPIVWGDRVYVTASSEDGAKRQVICISTREGQIVWNTPLIPTKETRTYKKTGFAAATPVTDGERVYAFFDSPGLVALDTNGNILWQKDLGPFSQPYNMASSPVLTDDSVVLLCDHSKESFIAAFSAAGEERWKTPRPTSCHSSTPLVITVDGKKQIVTNAKFVRSYDAADGNELWSCEGMKPYVTPSPVFDGSLVYAASGRNGPALTIDPTGRGDVSETHVRAHVATGGPYVPSPIVYPYLFLPGDNGTLRCVDSAGGLVAEKRVDAHFTASPVAAENRIYWTSERGDTYVIDVSKVQGPRPALDVIHVNPLGEKVLASPAIASGRLYIRTNKHLFCIAGTRKAKAGGREEPLADATFAELEKLYKENMGAEQDIDKVSRRLELVGIMGRRRVPEAVPFLKLAAKDHNDVGEEAVKLLGLHGEAAVPTLLELLEARPDYRLYLTIVPAEHLGRMRVRDASPALLRLAKHREALIRIASLKAAADIAAAHRAEAAPIGAALEGALDDAESVVKQAAIQGLARISDRLADRHDAVVAKLLDLAADRNPIVAEAARKALSESFKVPQALRTDEILYGAQRKDSTVEYLRAGPIHVKFQDGELRYLCVGEKEIVRRIYFAVRDARYDTIMPDFSSVEVRKRESSFDISVAARCRSQSADYSWRGLIEGTSEGRITFTVLGKANANFKSPRVGLNVLYGAESLAGQKYELTGVEGKDYFEENDGTKEGEFPGLISPKLIETNYRTLRYTTGDGMEVITDLALVHFGLEDQRAYADSSYKAFSGIPHKYPNISEGDKGGQTLIVEVRNAKAVPVPAGSLAVGGPPLGISIGEAMEGTTMPRLLPAEESAGGADFGTINNPGRREQYAEAEQVALRFTPAIHQPDEDTFMENISAIRDQVATIRSFAPKARFRIDPISIESRFHTEPDVRNRGLFAAAWCARMVKYMAIAGVDEAVFKVGLTYAKLIQTHMAAYAGKTLLATSVGPHDVLDALAVDNDGRRVVWVINKTDRPQTVMVKGLTRPAWIIHLNADTSVESGLGWDGGFAGPGPALNSVYLKLMPFEVSILSEGPRPR